MSIEASKSVEETQPVETKAVEPVTETPALTEAPAAAETTEAPSAVAATDATPATDGLKKGETVVEAVPASEGVLGYKAPGFLKQFIFSKQFFWFSDEPVSSESLNAYIRSEKTDSVGHHHAAWARETGKGVLFHAKRAEDKTNPTGVILLHEVSNVTKEGSDAFSIKVGTHTHKFEASTAAERDSWVVAIEKKAEEARDLKDEITGRETYKKNVDEYAKTPAQVIAAAGTARSKSKEPITATAATPATTEAKIGETSAPVEEKKPTQKERSQSRKRASIFGSILGKKDEKEAEHDAKKEAKAEDKAEKKAIKEEKKEEAHQKKEEAKATHDHSKATEAAEAAAVAAVPAAAIAAVDKKEDKEEEKTGATTPTDKKAKRGSVFGSLFGKKGVTSPTAEKSEKEVGPATPAKDSDVPPVSETAPKLDEPIENKPIDTAAVTAPADAVAAEPATVEAAKETTPVAAGESSPKTEKKGGFLGFIKKAEIKKDETKEEKATEAHASDVVAPAAVATTDGTTESPATKEERPAREKRRTSLFAGLGTMKRKTKEEKETSEANEETVATETKREKSPLPSKIGGLFRKPSKAVKSEEAKDTPINTESKAETAAVTEGTPATTEAAATAPFSTVPESTDSKIVGDVVPDQLHTTVHDSVTTAPQEVKASA